MQFLKMMRKREFIEMGLKTAVGILLGIIAIFFMEAMIHNIYMNAIRDNKKYTGQSSKAEYYIVENDDKTYDVYLHYNDDNGNWALKYDNISQEKLDEKLADSGDMFSYRAQLYKIVAKQDGQSDVEYTFGTNNTSAYSQVQTAYSTSNEGVTFDLYKKKEIDDDYSQTANYSNLTYAQLTNLFSQPGEFKEYSTIKIFWRAPNCFDVYMNGVHYAVMALFLLAIGGIFAWRFTLIAKEYKKLERKFQKTGKIF